MYSGPRAQTAQRNQPGPNPNKSIPARPSRSRSQSQDLNRVKPKPSKPKPRRKAKPNDPQDHGPETMEFQREFSVQTDKILRRRLIWFISIWGGIGILGSIPVFIGIYAQTFNSDILDPKFIEETLGPNGSWLFIVVQLLWTAGYIAAIFLTIKGKLSSQHAVAVSMALILLDGVYGISLRAGGAGIVAGLQMFAISHFVASLVFPWSAKQAAIPAVIVLALNALSLFLLEGDVTAGHVFTAAASPLLAVPGCLVAWSRHSRRLGKYRLSFVQKRYGTLRQELAYARAIHETMFPAPRTGQTINFTYKYEPMRQIGGDYLYASHCPTDDGSDEALSIVLLDVTGHGIPAALTVNRLHGEIELLFADNPFIEPGEVLARLNRYVYLTLSRHSIFVTAVCLKADPLSGTIRYASGGHPPGFLRAVDGTVTDLDSTAFVLGACPDDQFDPDQQSIKFGPGDSLITYTDGATEARQESGKMLRISGMRSLLATRERVEPGHWPGRLLDAVTNHREGLPPEDDTLVVEMYRSLKSAKPRNQSLNEARGSKADLEAQPQSHHSRSS